MQPLSTSHAGLDYAYGHLPESHVYMVHIHDISFHDWSVTFQGFQVFSYLPGILAGVKTHPCTPRLISACDTHLSWQSELGSVEDRVGFSLGGCSSSGGNAKVAEVSR